MTELIFKSMKRFGLEYWVCQSNGHTLAISISLPGVRAKVMQLIKHKNWN